MGKSLSVVEWILMDDSPEPVMICVGVTARENMSVPCAV